MSDPDPMATVSRRSPLRGRSRAAVFLCYHSVADDGPPFLSLTPRTFESQLRILADGGYASGTRADLDLCARGAMTGARRAFLTFDDGFADTVETALPAMAAHGFTGIVFPLAHHLDTAAPLAWPEVAGEVARRPGLMRSTDWEGIGKLVEAGWEVGSHGITHARMPTLSDEALAQELLDSRRLLEERLGRRCDLFAYPFGDWDERVARAAAAAGYAYAFSLPFGEQSRASRLSVPRVMVDDRDDSWRFRAKLTAPGRAALLSPLRPMLRKALRRRAHSHAD
ncbi:MAG TPA: polysaccharide deacetylase family protein [Solirubrobacterales bacterium]|nr:polysaccharide deacetylase family protein [Solirubrobacterales bacterium]